MYGSFLYMVRTMFEVEVAPAEESGCTLLITTELIQSCDFRWTTALG